MLVEKNYYSLDEAATRLGCKPSDLIHLATKYEITLLVGVPDGISLRTYDGHSKLTNMPGLMEPELLALSEYYCQKIEVNGKTKQSDFPKGFRARSDGSLELWMPYVARPEMSRRWSYWRTYRGNEMVQIELTSKRLFVLGKDVKRLEEQNKAEKHPAKTKAKSREQKLSDTKQEAIPSAQDDKRPEAESSKAVRPTPSPGAVSQNPTPAVKNENSTTQTIQHGMLNLKEVQEITKLSRSTIYDKINPKSPRYDPSFPKQVQLGGNSVRWRESEISAWLESRQSR